MTFFAILLLLMVVVAAIGYLMPLLIGLVILGVINGMSLSFCGKKAPILWDILTVGVTIYATSLFYRDVSSDAIDYGAKPFLLLVGYFFVSILLIVFMAAAKHGFFSRKKEKKTPKKARETKKRTENKTAQLPLQLVVETKPFDRFGAEIKCYFAKEHEALLLNFELLHTEKLAEKMREDADLTLRANIYDRKGNLLRILEACVEQQWLQSGYAADYFYLSDEVEMSAAAVKLYALVPLRAKNRREEQAATQKDPCPEQKKNKHWSADLQKGINTASGAYDWKLKETWEDYPAPNYDDIHMYCSVVFEEGGKSFYYRTRNPELKVGDAVYVPVGRRYQKRIGRIVAMESYDGRKAPYPLEKTKFIIGKAE